jgi:hypothetical protein
VEAALDLNTIDLNDIFVDVPGGYLTPGRRVETDEGIAPARAPAGLTASNAGTLTGAKAATSVSVWASCFR